MDNYQLPIHLINYEMEHAAQQMVQFNIRCLRYLIANVIPVSLSCLVLFCSSVLYSIP